MPPAVYLRHRLHAFSLSTPSPSPIPNRGSCLLRIPRAHNPNKSTPAPSPTTVDISNPKLEKRSLSTTRPVRSPAKYAVLGAGFAGLSVTWHLLEASKCSGISIDIYDENGIGGGASGVSGGLLHPYSPKVKVLWNGAECWKESLKLLTNAERATEAGGSHTRMQYLSCTSGQPIIMRRGLLRPVTAEKNLKIMEENVQSCLESCTLELIGRDAAQTLIPDMCVPFNSAVYMPLALSIHPKRYLEALLLACQNLADKVPPSSCEKREINLLKIPIKSLSELAGSYDAVITCLGANADMLPELSGKLPLRTCRGVVVQLELPAGKSGEHRALSPSILSDAWLAFQGPRSVLVGSTWEWKSRNYSLHVTEEEASRAVEELLPKASMVFPAIKDWEFVGARAGLRAMPPLTDLGSLPLLGCVNDAVRERYGCNYWLFGGLGSRGLLYHGLLGKLMAQAVISSNENVLPPELTSWKMMKVWKGAA